MKTEIRKKERKLQAGDFLFREGEAPQCMYLIKTGVISLITQKRGRTIELIRVQSGQLLGELAFFNREPRTASAKALTPVEVLEIPFNEVQQEFESFPIWVKTMLNTMSGQVVKFARELKQFKVADDDQMATMNMNFLRYLGSLVLAQTLYGETKSDGVWLNVSDLRTVTSQITLLPFNKMTTLLLCLSQISGFRRVEDLSGEFFIIEQPQQLSFIVRMLDTHLLKSSSLLEPLPEEVTFLRALTELGKDLSPDHKNLITIPAPKVLQRMKQLGTPSDLQVADKIIKRGLAMDKLSSTDGVILRFHKQEMSEISMLWDFLSFLQAQNPLKADMV